MTASAGCTSTRTTASRGCRDNLLIWWRGETPLFELDGGTNAEVRFAVQLNDR
jgi:hypothetical protein